MNERRPVDDAAMNERSHLIDGAAVSARPHVIEIDRIVLDTVAGARPRQLAALIEAELGRALGGSASPAPDMASGDVSVAGEIARAVVRSIKADSGGA